MSKYYSNELQRLVDSEFNKTVIVSDGLGNKTKTLDLNIESIKELMKFLSVELKKKHSQKETK